MATRKGKIARLPFDIRENINHQLQDNVPVKDILNWLNTDGAVRHYMVTLFQGRYITEQNISEWRQGGHQEWLTHLSSIEEVRDFSEDAVRMALTDITGEHLVVALTAMFAAHVKKFETMDEIAFNRKLIRLQHLIKTALSLRCSEQKDERLKIDRERLELLRVMKGDKSLSTQTPANSETQKSPDSAPGTHQGDSTSRHSSFELRHSFSRPAHPLHPKAPEIRRPPLPIDPNAHPDDPDWPSLSGEVLAAARQQASNLKPVMSYKNGPDPDEPPEPDAGPDGPYAPSRSEFQRPSSGIPYGATSEINPNHLD